MLPNKGGETGLDAGLTVLYTDSSGKSVPNPRTQKKHEKKIARLAKKLSRKKRGSKNREKAKEETCERTGEGSRHQKRLFA